LVEEVVRTMTQQARRIWVVVFVVVIIAVLAFAGVGEGPNRPLEGQAGRDAATWLDGITAVALLLSPFIAVSGVVATIIYTNRQERDRREQERLLARDRQEHERLLKEAELEDAKATRLRDERIAAYRKLLVATTAAHHDRAAVDEIGTASAEISLIASSDEIERAARTVWVSYWRTQKASAREREDPDVPSSVYSQALSRATDARDRFLTLAREELGIKGRFAGFRDLEGEDPGEELPGPETPSSGR